MMLLMGWVWNKGLAKRFESTCDFLMGVFPHWKMGKSFRGWVQAMQTHGPWLVEVVKGRLRKVMLEMSDHQTIGRWFVLAVDGTKIGAPRTRENQDACAGVGKQGGKPQFSLTGLIHLGLQLPWEFRVGTDAEGERTHLVDMIPSIPAGTLLVADAGFAGYDLCRSLLENQIHFLFRVGGNVTLLEDWQFDSHPHGSTVLLWPRDEQRRCKPPLELRLIKREDLEKEPVYLATNILDERELSREEALSIFSKRWSIEVFYRTTKQTLEHDTLRSRKPETCLLELAWRVLSVWLLGLVTIRRLTESGKTPNDWSPARSRDVVQRTMQNQAPVFRRRISLARALAKCLKETCEREGPKDSRDYPRKKKQRPPGPPKIKTATEKQIQMLQQLTPITLAV